MQMLFAIITTITLPKIAKFGTGYITPLTWEQFNQTVGYSHGSIRNQIIHIMNVDAVWFNPLRGVELPDYVNPGDSDDLGAHPRPLGQGRATCKTISPPCETVCFFEKPFAEGEDKDLILWQVLIHVVNHGTDHHRPKPFRLLNDLGVKNCLPRLHFLCL